MMTKDNQTKGQVRALQNSWTVAKLNQQTLGVIKSELAGYSALTAIIYQSKLTILDYFKIKRLILRLISIKIDLVKNTQE